MIGTGTTLNGRVERLPNGDAIWHGTIQVEIDSFGYGHNPTPPGGAHIVIDLRTHFRNPHVDPQFRDLNGLDKRVIDHVWATPGIANLVVNTAAQVADLLRDAGNPAKPNALMVRLAVGCVGGRHRSVAVAEMIASQLWGRGIGTQVFHRDLTKPVIQK